MDLTLRVFGYSSTVGTSRAGNEYQIDSIIVGVPMQNESAPNRTVVAGGFETYHQRCVPELVKIIKHELDTGAIKPGDEVTFSGRQSLYNGQLSTSLVGIVRGK